ncbi:hypothetical protein FHR90_000920 [Endobacter medicaginis]|jgi:uncharacterized protein|uniref:MAPEG family protein n=1 Tax=Endobacter medicaginis TaxID=1181271 RepID=A0A839V0D7_9PROT|nr:MAPEG family protein [Endobacter medicaginis]MBB3173102.1 hypothetical protein [Endobacter medicaginis]MCX5474473.1 MAPEG family protein [Endobacter medicaginis]NVN31530.1 MAPEG family protein [Endobacter medicaginis]
MSYPSVTAFYACLFGLVLAALSIRVIAGRVQGGVIHGDGGQAVLQRCIRAHANFVEYVPLVLGLAALLEMHGATAATMHALLAPLLVARLAHPFGMQAPLNSKRQYGLRGGSVIVTLLVLVAVCVLLGVRLLGG